MTTFYKPLAVFFLCLGFFGACKDNSLTIDKINFSQMQLSSCSGNTSATFLYKTEQTQALMLLFKGTNINPSEEKQIGSIPQTFELVYRTFSAAPSGAYFCSTPPAINPVVTQEIKAQGGEVEIITQKITQGTQVVYQHHIYIKNLVLKNAAGEQLIDENFVLGTYQTR